MEEQKRAERICKLIEEYHLLLANIYENLVDREFKYAQTDIQFLIIELRYVLKSIQEDDF